jgi:hypothetical protein
VDCERYDGFQGAIHLQLRDLPPGFVATETDIEAGENSALLFVSANATALTAPHSALSQAFLAATAKVGAAERTREVRQDIASPLFTVLPNPDLVVTTDRREALLQPGQETIIEVRVDRKNGFSGRIPVDVRNLPLGVRVLDIGLNGVLITEADRSRKFVLYCEPWVKPQTRPFYVVGNVEGAMGYAAPSLTLRIEAPRTAQK